MTLAVLESRWNNTENLTLRPLFELLQDVRRGKRTNYLYERFLGEQSFAEALTFFRGVGDVDLLYVGAHGSKRGFGAYQPGLKVLTYECLRHQLEVGRPKSLCGVYLGSCSFGRKQNRERLLQDVALRWVAGYSKEIDWEESYALDLLFIKTIIHSKVASASRKAEVAAKHLRQMCEGLVDELGFGVSWVTEDGEIDSLP